MSSQAKDKTVWGIWSRKSKCWIIDNDRRPVFHSLRREAQTDLEEVFGKIVCEGEQIVPSRVGRHQVKKFTAEDAIQFRIDYGFWPWRKECLT